MAGFCEAARSSAPFRVGGENRSTGLALAELAGLDADHLNIGRFRRDVVGLGPVQRRAAGRKAQFGLRQVGAGDLAGSEAVARLAQRRLQHLHVIALKLEQGGVAQQIHIGGGRIEQDRLLGGAQRLACSENLALGQPCPAGILESIEKRLGGRQTIGRDGFGADRFVGGRNASGELIQVLFADRGGPRDVRTIARQRDADILIGGAGSGALRVHLRIIPVGKRQRALERVGDRPMHRRAGQRGSGDQNHPRGPPKRTRTYRAIQHCLNPPPPTLARHSQRHSAPKSLTLTLEGFRSA